MIAAPVPHLVLDTHVWLEGLVFADPRVAPLFAGLRAGAWIAASNAACREEWRRVLRYPVLGLDPDRQAEGEAAYDALAQTFDCGVGAGAPLPRCRDRDDQKFLELARDAGAVALLTRDAQLLRLARRARRAAGFAILAPETFVPPLA